MSSRVGKGDSDPKHVALSNKADDLKAKRDAWSSKVAWASCRRGGHEFALPKFWFPSCRQLVVRAYNHTPCDQVEVIKIKRAALRAQIDALTAGFVKENAKTLEAVNWIPIL